LSSLPCLTTPAPLRQSVILQDARAIGFGPLRR
jgi:hypothetical protein